MGFAPPGVKVPDIRLSANGDWFVDGEQILHEKTCAVLTRNVQLLPDGTFATAIGYEMAPIRVDDVGFFVASIDGERLTLSDESHEVLTELRAVADGRLYARVKSGRAWALFSRAAHQSLQSFVEEEHGRLGVRIAGRFLPVS